MSSSDDYHTVIRAMRLFEGASPSPSLAPRRRSNCPECGMLTEVMRPRRFDIATGNPHHCAYLLCPDCHRLLVARPGGERVERGGTAHICLPAPRELPPVGPKPRPQPAPRAPERPVSHRNGNGASKAPIPPIAAPARRRGAYGL